MARLLFVFLFLAAPARAEDATAAQAHYARGAQLYQEARYSDAIDEFEAARRYAPLPAFDYNIGRCQERLGENTAAIAAYERYLRSNPFDAPDVRARIARLRPPVARAAPTATVAPGESAETVPPPEEPAPITMRRPAPIDSRRGLRVGAGVLLGTGLALTAAGLGLTLSVGPAIDALRPTCEQRQCGPADVDGLHQRLDAGWALIGIGAAALVADMAMWIVASRRPRHSMSAERKSESW